MIISHDFVALAENKSRDEFNRCTQDDFIQFNIAFSRQVKTTAHLLQ